MENRFRDDSGYDCLLYVDGVDFKISGFNKCNFTPKFRASGLRWEVATSIKKGDICWIFGPFRCGEHNDLQIFRMGLMDELVEGEKVCADKIYGAEAPHKVKAPGKFFSRAQDAEMLKKVSKRHEHVNKRFKQWAILREEFRHNLGLHQNAFAAVAVMTQLCFEHGEPLASVDYVE